MSLAGSLQNSPESSESFPNHFDSGPTLDPRSKIAQRSCAGNLGSIAQPNHPNHFDSGTALDPRSKIAQGSCQGILDPTLTRWIQDCPRKTSAQSWILEDPESLLPELLRSFISFVAHISGLRVSSLD